MTARAMMHSSSMECFVTERVVQALQIKTCLMQIRITSIGAAITTLIKKKNDFNSQVQTRL